MHRIYEDTPSGTWMPERIAYLLLTYTGSGGVYSYSYESASGYYPVPQDGVGDFLDAIRNHQTPPGTRTDITFLNGLDFMLEYKSFLIFQLDRPNDWQFRFSADGITTTDVTLGEYFELYHILDSGASVPGSRINPLPNVPLPTDPCHIAYFSAVSPSLRGSNPDPAVMDGFNLYVFRPNDGGNGTIDPDIKNTGHHQKARGKGAKDGRKSPTGRGKRTR